jgi:hypothetical protein
LESYLTINPKVSRTVRAGIWLAWLVAMIFLAWVGFFHKGPPSGVAAALTQLIPNGYLLFLLVWILPGAILWQILRLGEGLGVGLSIGIGALASLMGFIIGVPVFFAFLYVLASITSALGH